MVNTVCLCIEQFTRRLDFDEFNTTSSSNLHLSSALDETVASRVGKKNVVL